MQKQKLKADSSASLRNDNKKDYVVMAPSLALLTLLAYLAKTPRLKRGSGAFHAARRLAISASGTLRVSLRLGMSKVMVSPSWTAAMGPPR